MKLPCPHCGQSLNLPDRFAGKVTKCPACQQSFEVPGPPEGSPEAAAAVQGNIAPAIPKNDELALHSLMEEKKSDGPPPLTVCPACNAPWKKNATECGKCRYNVFIGGKIKRGAKRRRGINIDAQQVFLYMFIAGILYGGYWLYNGGWNMFSKTVNKTFDDAARGHPDENDDTVMKRRNSEKSDDKK